LSKKSVNIIYNIICENSKGINMILNLYGNDGLVFNTLATGFTEAHLQDSFKFDVVKVDDVGSKFKDAVKKEFSAKFLDDSDMVIRFAIPTATPPEEEETEGDEESTEEETPAEETSDDTEENEDNEEADAEEEAPAEEEEKSDDEDEEEDEKKQTLKESTTAENDVTQKIIKTVKRCLFVKDTETVEISDLPDFMEGYKVAFIKISLTEKTQAV
jgi:cobalamin biosynthesis protein CobT